MYSRRMDISADLAIQLNINMSKNAATLQLTQVETHVHTICQNVTSYNLDNLLLVMLIKIL